MCRLFGFQFRNNAIDPVRKAMLTTHMAFQADKNGGHSWGVVGIRGNSYQVFKGIGELSEQAHVLGGFNTLFAHTRFATTGDITIQNAHPFRVGRLLGAHNGMIMNHEELNHIYRRNFEVDSKHIFAHINDNLPINELQGYGAIEWIERDNPSHIYLARFRGGELAIYGIGGSKTEPPDGIVWASNDKHLAQSLISAGIKNYHRYNVDTGRVYEVADHNLFVEGRRFNLSAPPPDPEDEPPYHLMRHSRYAEFVNEHRRQSRVFHSLQPAE